MRTGPTGASAKVAVLGLVLERPSYGYELVSRFGRVFGEQAWAVSPAAVYKALNDLERASLIEPIEAARDASTTRQPKQHYRATAKGARFMREWLATPMPNDPSRAELLVRLNSGVSLNPDGLVDVLGAHAGACLEELERIAAAPGQTILQRLAKEQRRLTIQAQLSWIDYARAELRGLRSGSRRSPGVAS